MLTRQGEQGGRLICSKNSLAQYLSSLYVSEIVSNYRSDQQNVGIYHLFRE
jgi:hypothetical protein